MHALVMAAQSLITPVAFGVVGAVFDEGRRVLLVRQSYVRGWRLPGGGVGRGELPSLALKRELHEEVGLTGGGAELFGLYSRKSGWATNVVALYRIQGAAIAFRPNLEVREILFAPLDAPPPGTTPATLRRLEELTGGVRTERW